MNAPHLTRRDFTASLGGIVLAFSLAPTTLAQKAPRLPGGLNNNRLLSAWIAINADSGATVFTGKVELGQGVLTALSQIAAEELDLPLARVKIISGDTARTPNEGQTAGSLSIQNSGTALRLAGAEVRSILIDLAAKKLGVAADSLKVADGTITASDGRKVTYGELAREADLKREATGKVRPKPPGQHRLVGKSLPRVDLPAKVTGGVAYVQDLRLPSMAHGRIGRPPQYGAQLEAFDEAKVRKMPGVVAVVRDGSFLGVVAEREEQAIKAVEALSASAKWKAGPLLPDPARLYEQLKALPAEDSVISSKDAPLLASGAKVVEAAYRRPYQAHASMGPSCAVAQVRDGQLTVWTHSQGVYPLRATIARALGMKPPSIRCIHMESAGCYGHNGADDVAFDAALLARATNGRPVRVQWMRAEEFMWEPYGSAMIMEAKGAVADGRIVDWSYDLWSQGHNNRPGDPDGINLLSSWYMADAKKPGPARKGNPPNFFGERNSVPTYDLPRHRITGHLIKDSPLRTSALRTLGGYGNVFAVESFMDELAAAAGNAEPAGDALGRPSATRIRERSREQRLAPSCRDHDHGPCTDRQDDVDALVLVGLGAGQRQRQRSGNDIDGVNLEIGAVHRHQQRLHRILVRRGKQEVQPLDTLLWPIHGPDVEDRLLGGQRYVVIELQTNGRHQLIARQTRHLDRAHDHASRRHAHSHLARLEARLRPQLPERDRNRANVGDLAVDHRADREANLPHPLDQR